MSTTEHKMRRHFAEKDAAEAAIAAANARPSLIEKFRGAFDAIIAPELEGACKILGERGFEAVVTKAVPSDYPWEADVYIGLHAVKQQASDQTSGEPMRECTSLRLEFCFANSSENVHFVSSVQPVQKEPSRTYIPDLNRAAVEKLVLDAIGMGFPIPPVPPVPTAPEEPQPPRGGFLDSNLVGGVIMVTAICAAIAFTYWIRSSLGPAMFSLVVGSIMVVKLIAGFFEK